LAASNSSLPQSIAGTPALTTRGFVDEDFVKVADLFDRAVKIAIKVKKEVGKKFWDMGCLVTSKPPLLSKRGH
jgi:glycine hydroxymethyltransferase